MLQTFLLTQVQSFTKILFLIIAWALYWPFQSKLWLDIIHNNFNHTTWNSTLHKVPTFWENLSFILRQGQQSRTCTYFSFFTDPLTIHKRHLAFLQRHNTPDHDFVRLCDKIFTPYGQVLQVGTLHSYVFYPVPKLCFIWESHLCRSLYSGKCPSRIFFIQCEIFCIYIYIFKKTAFRQNTSFPFYNLYV